MSKKIFVVTFLFTFFSAIAQQDLGAKKRRMDSIKSVYLDAYALKYPIIRQAGIYQKITAPGSIESKLNGDGILKGKY